MPSVIAIDDPAVVTLAECIAGLDGTGFTPRDEDTVHEAARWLRRLGNNRSFLGDILLDALRGVDCGEQDDSAYTPQSLMLSGYRAGYFLRANIWPCPTDQAYRASGAGAFAYGVPHDHNFDFLTIGYHGPGYESDYWEYDYEAVAGFPGETAGLRHTGRRTLSPGMILHYRAHRDVHAQLPPQSLSVSLNIMATDPAQGWFDQYRFDPLSDTVTGVLSPNSTEVFLRAAVACGSEEALDLAAWIGRTHPADRLRLAAFEARAEQESDPARCDAIWQEAEQSGSRLVAGVAARNRREQA
ncbi:MAG: transposase [Sphingomonadaceae bacterium]